MLQIVTVPGGNPHGWRQENTSTKSKVMKYGKGKGSFTSSESESENAKCLSMFTERKLPKTKRASKFSGWRYCMHCDFFVQSEWESQSQLQKCVHNPFLNIIVIAIA